jgi:hypothetical protein
LALAKRGFIKRVISLVLFFRLDVVSNGVFFPAAFVDELN